MKVCDRVVEKTDSCQTDNRVTGAGLNIGNYVAQVDRRKNNRPEQDLIGGEVRRNLQRAEVAERNANKLANPP